MHHSLLGLTIYRQFVVYRIVPRDGGKADKLPCDWQTGKCPVNAHDPRYHTDADTAESTAATWGESYGVGFVFTDNDPFFFLDIDGGLTPAGWSPLAITLFSALPGCAAEISASGTGGHIIGMYSGAMPPHGCKNEPLGLELYHTGRFVALTGTAACGNCCVDCTAILPALVAQYFPHDIQATVGPSDWTSGPVPEWRGPTDDADLIRRAMGSRSAATAIGGRASFSDLWTGNVEALARSYPDRFGEREYDESQADGALAQHLAFWTGNDCARIDRLMRQSALVRDKWDSHASYVTRTVQGAVARQADVLIERDRTPATAPAAYQALTVPGSEFDGIDAALLQLKTQDAIAQVFEIQNAGKLLFNHSRGKWLAWDATRWRIETTELAFDHVRQLSRRMNWEGTSTLGSSSFAGGVEKFCRSSRAFSVHGEDFDADNYLLNTPGGTIDLRTGETRAHSQADRISLCSAVSPEPGGGAAFRRFLSEITLGDAALQEFLQVSTGACLSGAVEAHWLLFWVGSGRNGKNTLGDLIEAAMGDYSRTIPASTLMSARNGAGHPTDIANLQGIRLAVSSEVSDGDHWDESRIKSVTGDTTISARFMRQDFFEFRRTHKHLIYGNHRPQLRTVDAAMRTRLQIVPFRASFAGREDLGLPARLRGELGYVLHWLLEGHAAWIGAGRKLPRCAEVDAEMLDYFDTQSTPEMWLKERTEPVQDLISKLYPRAGDLYADYSQWKKERGENPVSAVRWAETMKRSYRKVAMNGTVRYQGLRLIPKFDLPSA